MTNPCIPTLVALFTYEFINLLFMSPMLRTAFLQCMRDIELRVPINNACHMVLSYTEEVLVTIVSSDDKSCEEIKELSIHG